MSVTPEILLSNVSKHYSVESKTGVSNINLSVSKGAFIAIVGESGSGKSTLLKLINGLLAPNTGEILFRGEHVAGPHERLIPGHDHMKMVNQDFNLNLYARVYDNIAGILSNEDIRAKEQKTFEMMEFLGIDSLSDKRIVELSGGEQQRVAIARAIITEPDILLLDEPFSQIDAVLKSQLRADLKRLCRFLNITIILVSHDPADGMSLADQMLLLKDGEAVEYGTPRAIYPAPKDLYTARLLGNAIILSSEEARKIGIRSRRNQVMFYPEWVQLKNSWSSKKYTVKEIFFRGFYEELLLERDHVKIRAVNMNPGVYKPGATVSAVIDRFSEYD